jgi:four helix bundle protein
MVKSMPNDLSSVTIARQIIRSGTSPAANYRAACLGKSDKDFVNKLKMVEEELDETSHWLDMIMACEILPQHRVNNLYDECNQLLKIITSSIITMKQKMKDY